MSATLSLHEFRTAWLPHVTDAGLGRLIGLLDSGSPLLIHGAFTKACAMGCLATHIAWHHPETAHLNEEAGIAWLSYVASLNPATSAVILEWDRSNPTDWAMRTRYLAACRDEVTRRQEVEFVEKDLTCEPCLGY